MSRQKKPEPITRDAMLRRFGYSTRYMTDDAKSSRATHMEKTHNLSHFYFPGKKMRHYWLHEVERALDKIIEQILP